MSSRFPKLANVSLAEYETKFCSEGLLHGR
jgi:hypothetical protein